MGEIDVCRKGEYNHTTLAGWKSDRVIYLKMGMSKSFMSMTP